MANLLLICGVAYAGHVIVSIRTPRGERHRYEPRTARAIAGTAKEVLAPIARSTERTPDGPYLRDLSNVVRNGIDTEQRGIAVRGESPTAFDPR